MKQINICITLPDHTLLDEFFVVDVSDVSKIPEDSEDYETIGRSLPNAHLINRIREALEKS